MKVAYVSLSILVSPKKNEQKKKNERILILVY